MYNLSHTFEQPHNALTRETMLQTRASGPVAAAIWHRLREQSNVIKLEAGKDLWLEGAGANTVYLMLSGLVRLYHLTDDGKAITMVAATVGGILGHHPYLDHPRRGMITEAMTETSLLAVPLEQVTQLMKECRYQSMIHAWLLRDIDCFHAGMYNRLQSQEIGASEKLVRVLLALSEAKICLNLNRRHLAELANLTVETTVRLIKDMCDKGLLKTREVSALKEAERRALTLLVGRSYSSLPYI